MTIDWRTRILERFAETQPSHDTAPSRKVGSAGQSVPLRAMHPADPVPAAVLVPIIDRQPECSMLLTVRASNLRRHAGQIAFPGGRIEDRDEGPAAAALREAWEEIGLPAGSSRVVGYLPDHLVFSGYRVTPVIALVREGFTLRYDPAEVADSFEIPLSHLFDPMNHRLHKRQVGGQNIDVYQIPYGERMVWGATAAILIHLYQVLSDEAHAA